MNNEVKSLVTSIASNLIVAVVVYFIVQAYSTAPTGPKDAPDPTVIETDEDGNYV